MSRTEPAKLPEIPAVEVPPIVVPAAAIVPEVPDVIAPPVAATPKKADEEPPVNVKPFIPPM